MGKSLLHLDEGKSLELFIIGSVCSLLHRSANGTQLDFLCFPPIPGMIIVLKTSIYCQHSIIKIWTCGRFPPQLYNVIICLLHRSNYAHSIDNLTCPKTISWTSSTLSPPRILGQRPLQFFLKSELRHYFMIYGRIAKRKKKKKKPEIPNLR